jgi:hypothetical protein
MMLKELIQCAKGLIVHMYLYMCTCVYKIYLRFEHVEYYHPCQSTTCTCY